MPEGRRVFRIDDLIAADLECIFLSVSMDDHSFAVSQLAQIDKGSGRAIG